MHYLTKLLALLFFSLPAQAESYTFSGGHDNFVHTASAAVLQKAYKNAGISVNFQFINLQESLLQSNAGLTDGEISRVGHITDFAPNLIKVPVIISSVQAFAYSRNKSITIDKWSDLSAYDFTIVKGAKFIETATEKLKKTVVASFEIAFENLQNNKTDIVVVPKLAGIKIIYQKKYYEIKAVSPILKELHVYHFVHKKNQHLIPIITPILQAMVDSGEVQHIRRTLLIKQIK